MTARKNRVVFQKQVKQYREHCCVPRCTASSKYNGLLSFHGFPRDPELRRRWLENIRRDQLKLTQHSKVCSLHFTPDQLLQPKVPGGRRMLHRGAVPELFSWSHQNVQPPRAGLEEPERRPEPDRVGFNPLDLDHDYFSVPEPAAQDKAVSENQTLTDESQTSKDENQTSKDENQTSKDENQTSKDENQTSTEDTKTLKKQVEELRIPSSFGLQRFTGSDDDIRFYTRFESYRLFLMFWRLIEPTVHKMIRSSGAAVGSTHTRDSLQPVDELLLFQMYLAAGLKEGDLANRFQIHASTASRIICSWAGYLYSLLGSLCVWMDADAIRAQLPEDFRDFPDTQVIVGCSELRCQTPASALLQSETSSKSHCVMRGLTGVAPHGAVTFVSSLYEGSVSDTELFMRSGLADRLTEDTAVMVANGFLLSDCVKCKVYCPPFLRAKPQKASENALQTQQVARLRVHVERLTRRVTENKLFDSVIPLSMAGNINKLFTVACLLVNYQTSRCK